MRDNWQKKISHFNRVKIYLLDIQDRVVVNKTFDKLHQQNRLDFTSNSTFFSYSVIVVWKTTSSDDRKRRVVVNIRELNDLLVSDVYLVSLQIEIVSKLQKCKRIAILEVSSFFYRWRVHLDSRHMLTVVTHREQKIFKVSIMSCMNSIAYVQRQIDNILRSIKSFAQVYIDDIVTDAQFFDEHVKHLRKLFDLLVEYNVFIVLNKVFLRYNSVNLLERRVNSLRMTTAENKLKTISSLSYSSTLSNLKHYLDLTEYLQSSVHMYAQLTSSLQKLKTRLLKNAFFKENVRKAFSSKYRLSSSSQAKKASFDSLQEAFSNLSILVHHNSADELWIDLNASHDFDFDVQMFHVKLDYKSNTFKKWSSKSVVKFILFLSRTLTAAERNYWSTKLEIVDFVWTIKKLRHIMKSFKLSVMMQTNHSTILNLMKQRQSSIIATRFTIRMNVQLIRVSQFLRQFRLDVRHKSSKEHIVSDALSRLVTTHKFFLLNDYSELNMLFVKVSQVIDINENSLYSYSTTLIQINNVFRDRLIKDYAEDSHWIKIMFQVDNNNVSVVLSFMRERSVNIEKLLFHINRFTNLQRLCISQSIVQDILSIAHDESHSEFDRCFEIVSKVWYIRDLIKQLRTYILHCSNCLILQTRRHCSYKAMQSVEFSLISFHTITLDFVLALSLSEIELEFILSIIDKFIKRTTFIVDKSTYTVKEWRLALLDRLNIADWDIFKIILSNRDSKFLSKLWV